MQDPRRAREGRSTAAPCGWTAPCQRPRTPRRAREGRSTAAPLHRHLWMHED